jgi:hypothetical protein
MFVPLALLNSADDIGRISEARGGRSLKIHSIYLQIIKQITAN